MTKCISFFIVLLAITIYLVNDFAVAKNCEEKRPKDADCCADVHSCDDPFFYSQSFGEKSFMIPWNKAERKGDWFNNRGYCHKYCAEMVTIHSAEENKHFLDFARTLGVSSPGVWMGGTFPNVTSTNSKFYWGNNENVDYSSIVSGEPNEAGFTCLHAAYDNSGDNALKWRNWYCTVDTLTFACQRTGSEDKRVPTM